jgi:hypothetical protein
VEIHAVVKHVVTESDVLVPNGVGPDGAVDVVIGISTGNASVDV